MNVRPPLNIRSPQLTNASQSASICPSCYVQEGGAGSFPIYSKASAATAAPTAPIFDPRTCSAPPVLPEAPGLGAVLEVEEGEDVEDPKLSC